VCTVTGLRWNSLPLIDVTYCYVSTAPLSGAHDVPSVITLTSDATFCASYNRSIMHATLQQPRGRPPECVLTAVLRGSIKSAVLCCAVPCCAVLCCSVPCRAVLCCAVLCRAVPCRAVLCCAVLCCAVLCRAVPCCAVLCCAVPCCAVPCRAVLCCAVPCCAVLCRAVPCCLHSVDGE